MDPHNRSAEEAAEYSVQGCRAVYVTALTQLGAKASDKERAGRWARGSSMPATYDSASGASELKLRARVVAAVKRGWRMAGNHKLPKPEPRPDRKRKGGPSGEDEQPEPDLGECGTPSKPTQHAMLGMNADGFLKCGKCFETMSGRDVITAGN